MYSRSISMKRVRQKKRMNQLHLSDVRGVEDRSNVQSNFGHALYLSKATGYFYYSKSNYID